MSEKFLSGTKHPKQINKQKKTIEETMVLYRKLWNFDLRRKQPQYFTKNYETNNIYY